MLLGESPAATIFSTSSRIAPLDTSDKSRSPKFGSTHLSSACCQPAMVAGLTGLRLRVDRYAIHFAAWARNVLAGAVFVSKYALLFTPSRSMWSRSFRFAVLREGHTPNETTRRFLSSQPGTSIQ